MMGWGLDDGFNFAMSVGQNTEDIHQAVGKMGSEQQEVGGPGPRWLVWASV